MKYSAFLFVSICMLTTYAYTFNRCPSCPQFWTQWGGSCYRYFERTRSWRDAESFCYSDNIGGHLVSIHSSHEQQFVYNLWQTTHPGERLWIGLSDQRREGYFIWSDGTSTTDYSAWKSGEPNNSNGNEDGVMLYRKYHGLWNDQRDTDRYSFVCKVRAT